MTFLSVNNLSVFYGKMPAALDVSLDVDRGEVVGLLGANGSGKSTVLKCIAGLKAPTKGEIRLEGERIDRAPVTAILKRGIAMVPEGRRLFPRMTVQENLEMGAYTCHDKAEIAADIERVLAFFPQLKEKRKLKAGMLSGGVQEMLAIGRALMPRPKVLLMDEPAQGLSPLVTRELTKIIAQLNRGGMTILLVEHNVKMALGLSHRIFILNNGRLMFQGTPQQFSQEEYAKRVYLGSSDSL